VTNRHKRHVPTSYLSLTDRLQYAALGAAFGAVIGFILFWLIGVYSNTLVPTGFVSTPAKLIAVVVAGFAAIGFIFGPYIGTAIGNTIAAIFEFERASFYEPPIWLVVLVLAAVSFAIWHWLGYPSRTAR
jgi:hypothetical protein